jgi:hypothetical protein
MADQIVARPGTGLLRATQLPQAAQREIIKGVRSAARVSVAPLFHRLLLNDFGALAEMIFFANRPAAGALSWWLGNFKNDYLSAPTNVFGFRFYLLGSGATVTNGAGIIVTDAASFAIGTTMLTWWNDLNNGLSRIKVNDTDHQWQDVSKMLAPLKYTEWGFDNGAGLASYGTVPANDTSAPYFIFRRADRSIDPIRLSKDDEFSITLRVPTALPAAGAGTCPQNVYLTCELMTELSQSLYAG